MRCKPRDVFLDMDRRARSVRIRLSEGSIAEWWKYRRNVAASWTFVPRLNIDVSISVRV